MEAEESHVLKLLQSDKKIRNAFDVQKKVGRGSFGSLYQALNLKNKNVVALKIELDANDMNSKNSNLINQIMVFERLKGVKGVPEMYSAGKWKYGYYMELELLSSSLHEEIDKNYSATEIKMMGIELLQILRAIHERGVVHQDLKPQNIMRNSEGKLIIIDFGLSTIYTKYQNDHKKRGFVGTPRYASLAAHEGCNQYPKDDIESLLYVLGAIFLKKAPWFELNTPVSNRLIMIRKYKRAYNKSWFKKLGKAFLSVYEHLQELQPQDLPDYSLALKCFQPQRKTVAINQVPANGPKNTTRRHSQNIKFESDIAPNILIHHVERPPLKQQSSPIFKTEQSRTDNSFSQIAQGDFMEFFKLVTSKILHLDDTDSSNSGPQNETVSEHSSEPCISHVRNYHQIEFKNPFSANRL